MPFGCLTRSFPVTNGYFDNAATSFPKPKACAREISRYLNEVGGPYGRSAYGRALEASRTVEEARDMTASLLGAENPERILFTSGATSAINTIIKGLNLKDGYILAGPLEHNAVMRPLEALRVSRNLEIRILPSLKDGRVDMAAAAEMDFSGCLLAAVNHMGNVNGVIQPIGELKAILGKIPLLVDASQSAGHEPITADEWGIDFLAFTGHKGLLGPTGTGGFFIRDGLDLNPLVNGGTGSRSESWETPEFLPDRFEAGTPNVAGLFGLLGSLSEPPRPAHTKEEFLNLLAAAAEIPGLRVHAAAENAYQGELFSITSEKADPSQLGMMLFERHGVETRIGLHCAPLAHRTLGTFPDGTVRIAPGPYHTVQDLEDLLKALEDAAA